MECDICSRKDVANVGMFCLSCARTSLYPLRLEAARILLEKDSLGKNIAAATSANEGSVESRKLRKRWQAEMIKATSLEIEEKIENQRTQISTLRSQISELRARVTEDRGYSHDRRSHLEAIKSNVPSRQQHHLEDLSSAKNRGVSSLDTLSYRSNAIKTPLCIETAKLLRFRRSREKVGEQVRDQYWISGFPIPDLRSINGLLCTDLTAILASCSHLLVLVAFYLGMQLPAEITLPQRNYPLGTINTPSTSYVATKKVFQGSGSQVSGGGPTTKQDKRPRPLFVGSDEDGETVSQFAKKDPIAFSFFIEGIALLAWNTSWLAQSQGSGSAETWSDTCKIGRNLYRLVFSSHRPPLQPRKSTRAGKELVAGNNQPLDAYPVTLGARSHASAHNFLPNTRNVSSLPKYTVISDSLRKTLITEGKDAEWEILGQAEFDDGAERFDEAIVVRNRNMDGKDFHDARSVMTARDLRDDMQYANEPRIKGTSGWTKLKSRESNP